MATNPVELPIRQNPQQAGLYIQRHIADFVEKEGAAIGLLKRPVTLLAPVKAPSWPNSSRFDGRSFGMAAMLSAMKFLWGRGCGGGAGMGDQLLAGTL